MRPSPSNGPVAEGLLLCTNTMHRVAPALADAVSIPLLHIVDATAAAITRDGIRRVALLGTRFTMEQAFYRGRLADHGLDVLVPAAQDRSLVHQVIYDELVVGGSGRRAAAPCWRSSRACSRAAPRA
jgi:aspartate racemase